MKRIYFIIFLFSILFASCKKGNDSNSNSDNSNISDQYIVSTLAGIGSEGFLDGAGNTAQFNTISDITVDIQGNVYVADRGNWAIRKISPSGQVTTLAGNGENGYVDGQGSAARFDLPSLITIDDQGNLYIVDRYRIRKVTPAGVVTTLAGSSEKGHVNGEGPNARFNEITGIAVDKSGNVYIIDNGLATGHPLHIRKITPAGVVSAFISSGVQMSYPLKMDGQGNLYLGGGSETAIAKYITAGQKSVLLGIEQGMNISGMALDLQGNIYFTKISGATFSANQVFQLTPTGKVNLIAGTGTRGFKDGAGNVAEFNVPGSLTIDSQSNIYVVDHGNNRIRKISKR